MEKIKILETFLGEYSNSINLIVTLITIIALNISIKSLVESKKAYTLSSNGARLEMKFFRPAMEYEVDYIIKDKEILCASLHNQSYYDQERDEYGNLDEYGRIKKLYVPETTFLCIAIHMHFRISLKNIGFIMSKNIYISVRFKNIIMTVDEGLLNDNNMCENGWIYEKTSFEGYGVDSDEIDFNDMYNIYFQKNWRSKDHDINIYPGQEIGIDLFSCEDLYMYGDSGKIIISIVGDQSEFIEKEYIIKMNDDLYDCIKEYL